MLARNCSLRRKDFDSLMDDVLADSQSQREEIERERARLVDKVQEYLEEQKGLAASLRGQLIEMAPENPDASAIEAAIASIRTAYQGTVQELSGRLRDFQVHLEAFCKEQAEMNGKLNGLVDRGDSLRTEDIRRLEAARTRHSRKTDRELRRERVETLLAHFRQHREELRSP